jgi:hypothetical protein
MSLKPQNVYELACDRCGEYQVTSVEPSNPDADAKNVRTLAAHAGWMFKDGKDICPQCSFDETVKPEQPHAPEER